jgi:hypothetical protein
MSISAKLYLDNKEYNILKLDTKISQETNHSGVPYGIALGGYFDIVIETTRESTILEWMLQSDGLKDVKIVIPSRFGTSASRKIDLKDTYCIKYNNSFTGTTSTPMTTSFRLSPGGVYENGEAVSIKHWHKVKPEAKNQPKEDEEKEEKKLILTFDADNTDIKNAKFGFDKFDPDFKNIYKGADFSKLENEYSPIQVYAQKYFPVWVSMRKGQTITLKLDEIKRKNYKLFNEIKFDSNSDFTFEPANLKDAKEVHITCNNSGSQTQIKVEGDGEVVGAINFFYPEPKEVNVRWVIVNFNKGDKSIVEGQVKTDKILKEYFKKAFNPALIDMKIVNESAENLDITLPVTNPLEQAFIDRMKTNLEVGKKDSVKQDDKSKTDLMLALNTLHKKRQNILQTDEIILYLTNLKSSSSTESPTDSDKTIVSSNNGTTVGNVSLMYLGNDRQFMYPPVEIPHEIMHALGLEHTFKKGEKHVFEPKSTKNYMDYSLDKEYTWKWQWDLLH